MHSTTIYHLCQCLISQYAHGRCSRSFPIKTVSSNVGMNVKIELRCVNKQFSYTKCLRGFLFMKVGGEAVIYHKIGFFGFFITLGEAFVGSWKLNFYFIPLSLIPEKKQQKPRLCGKSLSRSKFFLLCSRVFGPVMARDNFQQLLPPNHISNYEHEVYYLWVEVFPSELRRQRFWFEHIFSPVILINWIKFNESRALICECVKQL